MTAFHAAHCAAFLLSFEAVVELVFGVVSVVGTLIGEVTLFFAVEADLLVVARVFAVFVGPLAFWAIWSEVAFFSASEASELSSLRLLWLILLFVLVFAVICAVAWLFAMVADNPFALRRRTRLVESLLRFFSLVLSIRAVVEEMSWFFAAIADDTRYIGNSIVLVVIVGLI